VCEVGTIEAICKKKIELVKLFIIMNFVYTYHQQIDGLIDGNGNAILNFLPFFYYKNVYAIDKHFHAFTEALGAWWRHPHNNLNYCQKK